MLTTHPVILSIATTDSGGGAGIQADMKTTTVLGGFAVSVVAALTAQNGEAVLGIHPLPTDFIALQYEAVITGFPVKAAKLGMLYSAAIMEEVTRLLEGRSFPLVVDPVCVSQSGYTLLRNDAVDVLKKRIIPQADLLTPNRPEAEMLTGVSIQSLADLKESAARLFDMGAKAVLIKGGHFAPEGATAGVPHAATITDWLALPGQDVLELVHERVETTNNHGTGCTLSAAIATYMGFGLPLPEAVRKAQLFLTEALRTAFPCGKGPGAPDFLGGGLAVR